MPSKIDADPLLAALFDIPADVQVQTSPSKPKNVKGRHHRTTATGTTPSSKSRRVSAPDAGRRLHSPDDTGMWHGERISLTEEEYSDAVATPEKISTLQTKMKWIRSTIQSLEGDLITTRNALAHANQYLQSATMEIADMQRAALDTDAELSQFMQRHAGGPTSPATSASQPSPLSVYEEGGREPCPSLRSRLSSSSLNYFTPTSSIIDSAEESDGYTPRSAASCDLLWLNEKDRSHMPDEKNPDLDTTPPRRNYNSKGKRRFKFGSGGKVLHTLTGTDSSKEENSSDTPSTVGSTKEEESVGGFVGKTEKETLVERRGRRLTFLKQRSFIRVHDLALAGALSDSSSLLPVREANIRHVVNALFEKGLEIAMDESDWWSPESTTRKILSKRAHQLPNGELSDLMGEWPNASHGEEVLVFTAKCSHDDGYGSEYPLAKARGLLPTSAATLVELLLDSDRVEQYNKMSLGRSDEHCFAEGVEGRTACPVSGIQGEAKIVRSKSQPPIIRKPVELRLLLHARRLPSEGGRGAQYLIIGRSVWETDRGTAEAEDTSATRCELLLSINLIRDLPVRGVRGGEQWCEITTITHAVSPGIPISIGKRCGLAAAAKYIRDIRAVFK